MDTNDFKESINRDPTLLHSCCCEPSLTGLPSLHVFHCGMDTILQKAWSETLRCCIPVAVNLPSLGYLPCTCFTVEWILTISQRAWTETLRCCIPVAVNLPSLGYLPCTCFTVEWILTITQRAWTETLRCCIPVALNPPLALCVGRTAVSSKAHVLCFPLFLLQILCSA